jgi:hypothetical protein
VSAQGLSGDQFDNLYKYYRDVYAEARTRSSLAPARRRARGLPPRPRRLKCCFSCAQLTVDDIERYEQTYRGSAEEAHDLKELYTRFSGDMKQ